MVMRIIGTSILCLLFSCGCSAQKSIYTTKIDSLQTINQMPYYPELSGDEVFWQLTIGKLEIMPYLIERITDTTKTKANVVHFGGFYTTGDICVAAIEEIIKDFKTIELIESDPGILKEKAYGIYWEYVRSDFKNRVEFQRRVKLWYAKNKKHLVWQQDDQLYAVSDDENGIMKKRPAGGYYIVKK